jgi:hypothetical protein
MNASQAPNFDINLRAAPTNHRSSAHPTNACVIVYIMQPCIHGMQQVTAPHGDIL